MALRSFLFSLLVLNMCLRSESACTMANWWTAFDRRGWATCDFSNQYIKGLWRNHNGGRREKIYLLEQAKCCSAPMPYANIRSTCKILRWGVLDGWVYIGFHITPSKFKLRNCRYSWDLISWSTRAAKNYMIFLQIFTATAAGLAQSAERSTAERKVAGSIPEAGPILRVLKELRNEGTPFARQVARPSRGSDDHVKWRSRLQ